MHKHKFFKKFGVLFTSLGLLTSIIPTFTPKSSISSVKPQKVKAFSLIPDDKFATYYISILLNGADHNVQTTVVLDKHKFNGDQINSYQEYKNTHLNFSDNAQWGNTTGHINFDQVVSYLSDPSGLNDSGNVSEYRTDFDNYLGNSPAGVDAKAKPNGAGSGSGTQAPVYAAARRKKKDKSKNGKQDPETGDQPQSGGGNNDTNNNSSYLAFSFPGDPQKHGGSEGQAPTQKDLSQANAICRGLIADFNRAMDFVYNNRSEYFNGSSAKISSGDLTPAEDALLALKTASMPGSANSPFGDIKSVGWGENGNGHEGRYTVQLHDSNSDGNSDNVTLIYGQSKGYADGADFSENGRILTWPMVAAEAVANWSHSNITFDSQAGVSKPDILTQGINNFFTGLLDSLEGLLGIPPLQDLIFNTGERSVANGYYNGVARTSWLTATGVISAVFTTLAIFLIGFSLAKNMFRYQQEILTVAQRIDLWDDIKDLAITIVMLIIYPWVFEALTRINYLITQAFAGLAHADNRTMWTSLTRPMTNIFGLGQILVVVLFLVICIYYYYFYTFRSITIVILNAVAPLYIGSISLGGNYKRTFVNWFKELIANIFEQGFQAVIFAVFVQMVSLGSVSFLETAFLLIAIMPLTKWFRRSLDVNDGPAGELTQRAVALTTGALFGKGDGGGHPKPDAPNNNDGNGGSGGSNGRDGGSGAPGLNGIGGKSGGSGSFVSAMRSSMKPMASAIQNARADANMQKALGSAEPGRTGGIWLSHMNKGMAQTAKSFSSAMGGPKGIAGAALKGAGKAVGKAAGFAAKSGAALGLAAAGDSRTAKDVLSGKQTPFGLGSKSNRNGNRNYQGQKLGQGQSSLNKNQGDKPTAQSQLNNQAPASTRDHNAENQGAATTNNNASDRATRDNKDSAQSQLNNQNANDMKDHAQYRGNQKENSQATARERNLKSGASQRSLKSVKNAAPAAPMKNASGLGGTTQIKGGTAPATDNYNTKAQQYANDKGSSLPISTDANGNVLNNLSDIKEAQNLRNEGDNAQSAINQAMSDVIDGSAPAELADAMGDTDPGLGSVMPEARVAGEDENGTATAFESYDAGDYSDATGISNLQTSTDANGNSEIVATMNADSQGNFNDEALRNSTNGYGDNFKSMVQGFNDAGQFVRQNGSGALLTPDSTPGNMQLSTRAKNALGSNASAVENAMNGGVTGVTTNKDGHPEVHMNQAKVLGSSGSVGTLRSDPSKLVMSRSVASKASAGMSASNNIVKQAMNVPTSGVVSSSLANNSAQGGSNTKVMNSNDLNNDFNRTNLINGTINPNSISNEAAGAPTVSADGILQSNGANALNSSDPAQIVNGAGGTDQIAAQNGDTDNAVTNVLTNSVPSTPDASNQIDSSSFFADNVDSLTDYQADPNDTAMMGDLSSEINDAVNNTGAYETGHLDKKA